MSDLRNKVIRLAHSNPELRKDLLPLLKQAAKSSKYSLDGAQEVWWLKLGELLKFEGVALKIQSVSAQSIDFTVGNKQVAIYSERGTIYGIATYGSATKLGSSSQSSHEDIAKAFRKHILPLLA